MNIAVTSGIASYIIVGPWLQFVGLMLIVGGSLAYARKRDWGLLLSWIALAVSAAGFTYGQLTSPKPISDATLRFALQVSGYAMIVVGNFLQKPKIDFGLTAAYLGVGVNFAGFIYALIYP